LLAADSIESDGDGQAVALASEAFFQSAHARGFEVWQNDRPVHARRAEAS
jgi:hypothetical protein